MRVVQDDAETFVCSYHSGETNEPHWGSEDSPPSTYSGESEEDGDDEAESDVADSHGSDKEDAGFVTIADRPADEIGV